MSSPLMASLPLLLALLSPPLSAQDRPFGLEAPGDTPVVFAPGVVSKTDEHEFGITISPDGTEVLWAVTLDGRNDLRLRRFADGAWQEEKTLFLELDRTNFDPFHSRDGKRLFFLSRKHGEMEGSNPDLWVADKTDDGYANPRPLGSPPNSTALEFFVSEAADGTLYFASNRDRSGRDFDIFRTRPLGDGTYGEPELVPGDLNTPWYEADTYVAPDQSYLLVSAARRDGRGKADLYFSTRRDDGTFTEAQTFDERISTEGHEICPYVSPDGRWFFFSRDGDVYWVLAEPVLKNARAIWTAKSGH
ncbi:MAG: hypothetical protein AAGK22_24375 [Acidobacteriota bacterium]